MVIFQDAFTDLYDKYLDLSNMRAWGAVDLRIYLAQKNHGCSISAQSYDLYLHLAQLDILQSTLSLT